MGPAQLSDAEWESRKPPQTSRACLDIPSYHFAEIGFGSLQVRRTRIDQTCLGSSGRWSRVFLTQLLKEDPTDLTTDGTGYRLVTVVDQSGKFSGRNRILQQQEGMIDEVLRIPRAKPTCRIADRQIYPGLALARDDEDRRSEQR